MEFCNIRTERLSLLKKLDVSERGEIVTLARSIAKCGLLVPLTVKRILHTDRYEIISGIKRFYACRLAGMKTVPVYIISSKSSALSRLIIKRGERQDLFEEAEGVRRVLLEESATLEALTDLTGYSEKELYLLLKITKLGDFEREIIRRNGIPLEIAAEVASIDETSTRAEVLGEIIKARLNLPETKIICERARKGKKGVKTAERSPKFKDLRIFDNTITRAISLLKDAGIKADVSSEQIKGGKQYKIKIEN